MNTAEAGYVYIAYESDIAGLNAQSSPYSDPQKAKAVLLGWVDETNQFFLRWQEDERYTYTPDNDHVFAVTEYLIDNEDYERTVYKVVGTTVTVDEIGSATSASETRRDDGE